MFMVFGTVELSCCSDTVVVATDELTGGGNVLLSTVEVVRSAVVGCWDHRNGVAIAGELVVLRRERRQAVAVGGRLGRGIGGVLRVVSLNRTGMMMRCRSIARGRLIVVVVVVVARSTEVLLVVAFCFRGNLDVGALGLADEFAKGDFFLFEHRIKDILNLVHFDNSTKSRSIWSDLHGMMGDGGKAVGNHSPVAADFVTQLPQNRMEVGHGQMVKTLILANILPSHHGGEFTASRGQNTRHVDKGSPRLLGPRRQLVGICFISMTDEMLGWWTGQHESVTSKFFFVIIVSARRHQRNMVVAGSLQSG